MVLPSLHMFWEGEPLFHVNIRKYKNYEEKLRWYEIQPLDHLLMFSLSRGGRGNVEKMVALQLDS